jgi:hypothetical protein
MARSPRAAPVSIHVGRRGALNPLLGMQGTVEGPKRGRGPSAFFRRHLSRLSAPRPTIPASPDARSREPSPRARPGGNAPGLLAGPGFAGSRIGASWGPAPVRLRQAVDAGVGDEDGGIGISPKTRMAPCRASIPLPLPTRPRTRGATPTWRRALTPLHCIAGHLALAGRDKQLQPDPAMNFFGMDAVAIRSARRTGTRRPHHLMRDLENHPTHSMIEVGGTVPDSGLFPDVGERNMGAAERVRLRCPP